MLAKRVNLGGKIEKLLVVLFITLLLSSTVMAAQNTIGLARFLIICFFLAPLVSALVVRTLDLCYEGRFPSWLEQLLDSSKTIRLRGMASVAIVFFWVVLLIFAVLNHFRMPTRYGDATVLVSVLGSALVMVYGGWPIIRASARVCNWFAYTAEWDPYLPTKDGIRRFCFGFFIVLNILNSVFKYHTGPSPWYWQALSNMLLEMLVILTAFDAFVNEFWSGDVKPIRSLLEGLYRLLRTRSVAVISGILITTHLLLTQLFFFPFGVRQDAVTDSPWHWYQRELVIEYWRTGGDIVYVENKEEIRLVFDELKKAALTGEGFDCNEAYQPNFIITVRRKSDGLLLLAVDGKSLENRVIIQDHTAVLLTDKLKELLSSRLGLD